MNKALKIGVIATSVTAAAVLPPTLAIVTNLDSGNGSEAPRYNIGSIFYNELEDDNAKYKDVNYSGVSQIKAAQQVIASYIGSKVNDINFVYDPSMKDANGDGTIAADEKGDVYVYSVTNGVLTIKGTSPVAMTHGWYMWAKSHGYGMVDRSGSNIVIPDTLEDEGETKVQSPVEHHFMYNPVVHGYTTPYWGEKEWTAELNWMAVHGFDFAQMPIGFEAIQEKVFRDLGMTDADLQKFFAGPAFAPWQRMGNLVGWDENPYFHDWNQKQLAVGKKVFNRMHELEMIPVPSGFAGFVPKTLTNSPIVQEKLANDSDPRTDASNAVTHTSWIADGVHDADILKPNIPLFKEIGSMIVEETRKQYGDWVHYFLCDLFNEMAKPSTDSVASFAQTIYDSMAEVDPEAVWVSQGWNLTNGRGAWTQADVAAMLNGGNAGPDRRFNTADDVMGIPDDKMVLISSAEEFGLYIDTNSGHTFDYYHGFGQSSTRPGKRWIYSTIANMGGNTGWQGFLDFNAKGMYDVFDNENPQNKGNIFAYGVSPEGTENNSVIQEIQSDAGWNKNGIADIVKDSQVNAVPGKDPNINAEREDWKIDTGKWLANYSMNRYKLSNQADIDEMTEFWDAMRDVNSIYDRQGRGMVWEYMKFNDPVTPGAKWPNSGGYQEMAFEWNNAKNSCITGQASVNGALGGNAESIKQTEKVTNLGYRRFAEIFARNMNDENMSIFLKQDAVELAAEMIGYDIDTAIMRAKNNRTDKNVVQEVRDYVAIAFDDLDRLLAADPYWGINRWTDFARMWGDTPEQQQYYVSDAQLIVSNWGGNAGLEGYAGREWQGLVKDYYARRYLNILDTWLGKTSFYTEQQIIDSIHVSSWGEDARDPKYAFTNQEIADSFLHYVDTNPKRG